MNDNGAFATRRRLARELARGRDRLAGKQVVVWQFAMRELSEGDWKLVDMTLGSPAVSGSSCRSRVMPIDVRGAIAAVSAVPRPGSVPYKDHVMAMHLVDLQSDDAAVRGGQAMVYLMSMTNNVWTAAAGLRVGDEVELSCARGPTSRDDEGINRSELDDPNLQLQQPVLGEVVRCTLIEQLRCSARWATALRCGPKSGRRRSAVPYPLFSQCCSWRRSRDAEVTSVIRGKDGWLFLPSSEHSPSGRRPFWRRATPIRCRRSSISAISSRPLGVQLLMVPVPAKAAVYSEFLPQRHWWTPARTPSSSRTEGGGHSGARSCAGRFAEARIPPRGAVL